MVSIERRKARSRIPTEAVRLYLEANAARAGVRAAVLSDAQGYLIGGVGDVDQETLAAIGPLFVTGASPLLPGATEELVDQVVQNHDLYASRLEVRGETLVLTSIGSRFPEQRRAERALARIFGEPPADL
jgi:hypothetical protein